MRGMSGHTALATTQISIWDPKDPLRAGFLRTNFPSRVTDLPNFEKSQSCTEQLPPSLRSTRSLFVSGGRREGPMAHASGGAARGTHDPTLDDPARWREGRWVAPDRDGACACNGVAAGVGAVGWWGWGLGWWG